MDVIGRSGSDREQIKSRSKILQYNAEYQTFACINFSECREFVTVSKLNTIHVEFMSYYYYIITVPERVL